MSTPICHHTLGPFTVTYVDGARRDYESFGCACIGSACALWVPTNKGNEQYKLGVPIVGLDQDGDPVPLTAPQPNGSGWCADNLRREPWPDPAVPAKTGGAS